MFVGSLAADTNLVSHICASVLVGSNTGWLITSHDLNHCPVVMVVGWSQILNPLHHPCAMKVKYLRLEITLQLSPRWLRPSGWMVCDTFGRQASSIACSHKGKQNLTSTRGHLAMASPTGSPIDATKFASTSFRHELLCEILWLMMPKCNT